MQGRLFINPLFRREFSLFFVPVDLRSPGKATDTHVQAACRLRLRFYIQRCLQPKRGKGVGRGEVRNLDKATKIKNPHRAIGGGDLLYPPSPCRGAGLEIFLRESAKREPVSPFEMQPAWPSCVRLPSPATVAGGGLGWGRSIDGVGKQNRGASCSWRRGRAGRSRLARAGY